LILELGQDALRFTLKQLEKISDSDLDWGKLLMPELVDFRKLPVNSDAHCFSMELSYLNLLQQRMRCQGEFGLRGPMIRVKPSRMAEMLLMELEQACAHAVNFMLVDHGTTFDQEWHAVHQRTHARLEAEGQAAFLAGTKLPPPPQTRLRGGLRRSHAPWRISR